MQLQTVLRYSYIYDTMTVILKSKRKLYIASGWGQTPPPTRACIVKIPSSSFDDTAWVKGL
jgi:hypothetical protein